MSEEKKTYNGRVQFWERGCVGVKDFDDNIIISPSLQYTEIRETDGEDSAIVRKGDKWALTDLDGQPLCSFIYDRIVFIGEHCYKAGIYVQPDNGELIVEYADTRMTYAILDEKGNVLCDRSKGYHYISEVHEGEVTAAINGCCGIIDLQGNVLIDFHYKYIQPLGEEHYLVSFDGDDNYYATIIDRQGNVLIPAAKQSSRAISRNSARSRRASSLATRLSSARATSTPCSVCRADNSATGHPSASGGSSRRAMRRSSTARSCASPRAKCASAPSFPRCSCSTRPRQSRAQARSTRN